MPPKEEGVVVEEDEGYLETSWLVPGKNFSLVLCTLRPRWEHIWLNEGFASYFEYIGIEAIYERSFVWQMFFYSDQRKTKKIDTRAKIKDKTTVPETSVIRTYKEIRKMFEEGWRVYQRGACMLHMLRSMLGDEAFFSSVTSFFKENAYSSAVSRDLWKHLEEPAQKSGLLDAVNMTMQNMMEIWLNNNN